MGLFSFFNKNKQDRTAEDSGRFYSKDDDAAIGERARSKRATNAGAAAPRRSGSDPMLPEKKRARRRLVGAIALALAAAVGLPMLLDSEPKPLAGDIAIQIPSKDKAAPLPAPGVPASGVPGSGTPASGEPAAQAPSLARDKAVAAEDSVDKGEEIVAEVPRAAPKAPAVVASAVPARAPERKPEPARPQAKPEIPRPEHKDVKAEHKEAPKEAAKPEHKEVAKPERKEPKAEAKLADKPKTEEHPKAEQKARPADAARALAILEGKAAEKEKAKDKPAESASQKFVLQVAAMSSQEKAAEVQARLREAGISSWTQRTSTPSGELIRVRVGPLNKDEAEKVRAKLGRLGMSGAMTPV